MLKRRVLVCGGRHFCDFALFNRTMDQVAQWCDPKGYCLIEGDADGADNMAFNWGAFRGIPVLTVAPHWTFYGDAAGTIRNGWMLKFTMPDLVVAFPGGTGTANMIAQAREAGVDVFEVK